MKLTRGCWVLALCVIALMLSGCGGGATGSDTTPPNTSVPPQYVSQGGLTWMPVTFYNAWASANSYCSTNTINGLTGWRLPTQSELSALYGSHVMNGQGWSLGATWSSTPSAGFHLAVNLNNGSTGWDFDYDTLYVSCVYDTTPPITTVAPTVSSTTDTSTVLTVTSSEDGTGYYLALPSSASAPTVAGVLAGTAVPMIANVAATPTISGLSFYTAYNIYFIAKDMSNNVQATVQSVPVTTQLTSGYVAQGGLIWMPVYSNDTWANANTYCTTNTINGLTGWRMPTASELSALYTSGAMSYSNYLGDTWSSTQYLGAAGGHYIVNLGYDGIRGSLVGWDYDTVSYYVSCVR